MEKSKNPSKSLVDQIIDEMLIKIEKQDEFDPITFTQIKELVNNGDLNNVTKVIKALTSNRCEDETN